MGLDTLRERSPGARSPYHGGDVHDRSLPPLPPLDGYAPATPRNANRDAMRDSQRETLAEQELTEFVEFFTGSRRIVPPPQPPSPPHGRMRRATERAIHVAAMRPVVPLPARRSARPASRELIVEGEVVAVEERAPRRRGLRLPPLWLLVNLAVVLGLVIGFFPQIMTASAAAGCKWYRVRSGDTLWQLSQRYHVSIHELATANHIPNVNLIYVGQQMCIPLMPLAASNQPAPAQSGHAPTYSAPSNVRAFISYTLPYARQASRQTGWPVSMILAQWGLETGWRTHTFTGYNWGNCGAMPNQPMVGGTSAPGSPAAFAYAYTPSQGVEEYVHVAHLGYYTGVAPAWRASGADAAARALGRSPWDWGHYT
ncbi:MAG: LysM peptidoglycan-binding domain-containing protein, partial [Chloroflexota bacterium]|nr:LysM peptidoglycan-binding domain-containing protein [Chloroflexota bacterium]